MSAVLLPQMLRRPGASLTFVDDSRPVYLTRARPGSRPETTPTNPHTQLTQNAPFELQERLFAYAAALDGVAVGPSGVSVPGARAFHLPKSPRDERDAFMVGREFAHLHPPHDGSLHLVLPPSEVDEVIDRGWAERHPLAGRFGMPENIVMVYGPRDEDELGVVEELVRASHTFAGG
jgi:phospholipase/carboxylesterase